MSCCCSGSFRAPARPGPPPRNPRDGAAAAHRRRRPPPHWEYKFGLEARANYRDSDDNVFKTSARQGGVPVFEETVDPGSHYEFSDVTVSGARRLGGPLHVHF